MHVDRESGFSTPTGNDNATTDALLTLARAERAAGQPAEALAAYERAADSARRREAGGRAREVLGEWAELLAAAGEHEQAFALMREALKGS